MARSADGFVLNRPVVLMLIGAILPLLPGGSPWICSNCLSVEIPMVSGVKKELPAGCSIRQLMIPMLYRVTTCGDGDLPPSGPQKRVLVAAHLTPMVSR